MTSAAKSAARKAAAIERGPRVKVPSDPVVSVKCGNCGRPVAMPKTKGVPTGVAFCEGCIAKRKRP